MSHRATNPAFESVCDIAQLPQRATNARKQGRKRFRLVILLDGLEPGPSLLGPVFDQAADHFGNVAGEPPHGVSGRLVKLWLLSGRDAK